MLERKDLSDEYSILINQKISTTAKFLPLSDHILKKLPKINAVVQETAKAFKLDISGVKNTFGLTIKDNRITRISEPVIYFLGDGLSIRWGDTFFPLKDIITEISRTSDYGFMELDRQVVFASHTIPGVLPYIPVFLKKQEGEYQDLNLALKAQQLTAAYNAGDLAALESLVSSPIIIPESMAQIPLGSYQITTVGKKRVPYQDRFFTAYWIEIVDGNGKGKTRRCDAKGYRLTNEIDLVIKEKEGVKKLTDPWEIEITGKTLNKRNKEYAEYNLNIPVVSLGLDQLLDLDEDAVEDAAIDLDIAL